MVYIVVVLTFLLKQHHVLIILVLIHQNQKMRKQPFHDIKQDQVLVYLPFFSLQLFVRLNLHDLQINQH